jgi:hypothetical protein
MWLLMRRVLGVRRSIAIAAVGFYVGWIGVFPITVRPDALAALLLIASLTLVLAGIQNRSRPLFALGIAVGWFAGLAKQDAVVGVVMILGYVLWRALRSAEYRTMILPAVAGTLFAVLAMTPFLFLYDVPDLKANIVDGIANGFDVHRALTKAILPFLPSGLLLIALVIVALGQSRPSDERFSPLLIVVCGGWLVLSILTSLKQGTSILKYGKFMLVAIPSAAYWTDSWLIRCKGDARRIWKTTMLLSILLAIALANNMKLVALDTRNSLARPTFAENRNLAEEIVKLTATPHGRFLLRGSAQYRFSALLADQVWIPQYGVIQGNFMLGRYDDANLREAISETPTFLVQEGDFAGPPVLSISPDCFKYVGKHGGYSLYRVLLSEHD